MSLRSSPFKSALLPLLVAALAVFSVPSFAYDWQKVAPQNGGFSADFPGTPKAASKFINNLASYGWVYVDNKHHIMVMANTSDSYGDPLTNASAVLQGTEDGFLKSLGGKTTSRKLVQTKGANGKKLPSSIFNFVTSNNVEGVSKVIVDGDTVYLTVVMWGKGAHAAAVRKRFMASYKLLPRTRPPEPNASK